MTISLKSRLSRIFLFAFLVVMAAGVLPDCLSAAEPASEITVSAAISLKDALDEIAQLYCAEKPGTVIHFNLGASGSLQFQIEQGAPVDIFISAAPKQMDTLESEGLVIAGTRRNLVENELVLIVPRDKQGISSFQDLVRPQVKVVAVGEPHAVPAGKYAQEVLKHLGIYDELKPKFVQAQDVRQALMFVATGNADAGIVYRTDAMTSNRVTVAATAPDGSHSPIVYPVAVLKNSRNISAAKDFVTFLLGPKSSTVFQKYGFIPASR